MWLLLCCLEKSKIEKNWEKVEVKMLPEEVIQIFSVLWKGQIGSSKSCPQKRKSKGARAVVRPPALRISYWELLWKGSCSLNDIRWFFWCWNVHRLVALLPALPSLLGFSRVRRGPVANTTEYHCTAEAVGLWILLHSTGVIMNLLSYFMLFETIIEAFWWDWRLSFPRMIFMVFA